MQQNNKMVDVTNLTIKEVELNNKSRKGRYIYIKEKNKRATYYKYQEGVMIDEYINAYAGKLRMKKGGVKAQSKTGKKYVNKFAKTNIDKMISKGISETEIQKFGTMNYQNIHAEYKRMLKPLVKNQELINILAMEENVKKFKHRIQAHILFSSFNEKVKVGYKCIGKTLNEIKSETQHLVNKELTESDLVSLQTKGYRFVGVPVGIELHNYEKKIVINAEDKLQNVNIKLKFIKGK